MPVAGSDNCKTPNPLFVIWGLGESAGFDHDQGTGRTVPDIGGVRSPFVGALQTIRMLEIPRPIRN
jgi:hypothetical protein